MRISVQRKKNENTCCRREDNRRVRIKVHENQEIEQVDEFTHLPT